MSLPLQQHQTVVEMLDGQHVVQLLTLPTALAYRVRLVREEDYLLTQLGADYRGYARRTARLIPRVW